MLVPGLVFEELGFRYVGPLDGHDLRELLATLKNVKRLKGPTLLHVTTKKGKGYAYAERDPERFHKVEPFDLATGKPLNGARGKPSGARHAKTSTLTHRATFTEAFSDALVHLAECDTRIVGITAAMPEGTGLATFAKRFPERYLDVGMAEQHALGVAAGLARGGARPVVAIYSTFLQRAFDQIMHELCLQELPVILAIDRAGLVGEDGPTHHGVFDIAYLRVLPNLIVLSPKDPAELEAMLRWALQQRQPVALRYSRGGIVCGAPFGPPAPLELGTAEVLREGTDLALVALGSMVAPALAVAAGLEHDGIQAMVVNARFIKPFDVALLTRVADTGAIVTLEEAQLAGGFGSAVAEALIAHELSSVRHLAIGIPDTFVTHGDRSQLLKLCQLDPDSLTRRIRQWVTMVPPPPAGPQGPALCAALPSSHALVPAASRLARPWAERSPEATHQGVGSATAGGGGIPDTLAVHGTPTS